MKRSCAAFFVPKSHRLFSNGLSDENLEAIGFSNFEIKKIDVDQFVNGQWGGRYCEAEIRESDNFLLFGITFSFREFSELIEEAVANPQRTPATLIQFVSDFARCCDVLNPPLAFVEFFPGDPILEFVEYAFEKLSQKDVEFFADGEYPLLYIGEAFVSDWKQWFWDIDRDEVPMRKGRLFYHGSGLDRWNVNK